MNGIIYGIKDLSSEKIIYIGSTTDLCKRKYAHKYCCFTKQKDWLIYNYIREKTDREHFDKDFAFEVLYSAEFETKQELRVKEEDFIKKKAPCCNQVKAFLTNKERKSYHCEYMREYQKTDKQREYQKTDKRREYMREYNNKRREYMREYCREWRSRKKLA